MGIYRQEILNESPYILLDLNQAVGSESFDLSSGTRTAVLIAIWGFISLN
jgi:hypothetical protein